MLFWPIQIGGAKSDFVHKMTYDGIGNIWITGQFSETMNVGNFTLVSAGGTDAFLIKINASNGQVVFAERGGGTGNVVGMSVQEDAQGNLSFSYYKLNTNPKLKELYSYKSELIYDAIFSSGDGISEETAFYVINISDEYRILNILDFEFGGQQRLLKSRYDYLKLQENEAGIDGLYFEISRSLSHMKQMFK